MIREGIISFDHIAGLAGADSRLSLKLLEWAFDFLKFNEFNEGYEKLRNLSGQDFVDAVQAEMDFRLNFNRKALESVPADGPLIVVANHPHGIVDGLALLKALLPRRPDLRVVVNDLLQPVAPLRDQFLPISQEGTHRATIENGRKILGALEQDSALLFFPAGSVSHFQLSRMRVSDKPWNPAFARLISRSSAPILPVHVRGRNSVIYHVLYNSWITLSLVWLIREFLQQRGRTIGFTIGEPIAFEERHHEDLAAGLRESVYTLGIPND